MNDAREALYGLDAIEHTIKFLDLTTGIGTEVRRTALDWFQDIRTREESGDRTSPVLASMEMTSANGGRMDALEGFRSASMLHGCEACVPSLRIHKPTFRYVEYDEKQQARTISIIFNTAVNGVPATPTEDQLQAAAVAFVNAALSASSRPEAPGVQ